MPQLKNRLQNEQQLDIEQEYFVWLTSIAMRDMRSCYGRLLGHLHDRVFYWSVKYDENRAQDGRMLRELFNEQHSDILKEYQIECETPCTFLELLVSLAARMNDQLYRPVAPDRTNLWFITLLNNLELLSFTTGNCAISGALQNIDAIVDRVIGRTYNSSGKGGIFPLDSKNEDQRDVELWYQMMIYIEENYAG